jgi:hypothetical protein
MERSRPLQVIYPSFSVFPNFIPRSAITTQMIKPQIKTHDPSPITVTWSPAPPFSILHSQNLLGTAPPKHPELGH